MMHSQAGVRSRTVTVIVAYAMLSIAVPGTTAAQELLISGVQRYTENRGWNEAGLGPTYQVVINAAVSPSGPPTLVFVEHRGEREPMTLFALPSAGDLYSYWRRFDAAFNGPWRLAAERGEARAAAMVPAIDRPQKLPLARDVRAAGKGATPRVRWRLPALTGLDVDRIRVAVRGEPRVHGRFLSVLYVSDALPPAATSFRIPQGVLVQGMRYVFQVALEDVEDGRLENRSLAFSPPYTVPR